MNLTATFKHLLKRKLATAVLVTASMAAFATLGEGGKKDKNLLGNYNSKTFSLRSNYSYRGNSLLTATQPARFIMLNTVVTYQKGNATYIVPLKRKVLLDKVKFTLTPSRP
jgi:hypothetical protein